MTNSLRHRIGTSFSRFLKTLKGAGLKLKLTGVEPTRNNQAAGFDIYYPGPDIVIKPGHVQKLETGIYSEFNPGWVVLFKERSGMGSRGLAVRGGVLDCDYRGEWGILLHNTNERPYIVRNGDKIAQFVILPIETEYETVTSLTETERGDKGYGSSGR